MKTSLTSLFDSNKESLAEKLKTLSLPKDSLLVENTVSGFLNEMFESDNTYRLSLTQSEDYILQSAIQLLNAQKSIAGDIISAVDTCNNTVPSRTVSPYNVMRHTSIVGTGIGAVAGTMLGTWGAVCGAIAGTAIATYLTSKSNVPTSLPSNPIPAKTINVNAFVDIVKKICESIDHLMETYRIQVLRIENSYKNTEQESPLTTYSHLFSQLENLHDIIESEKSQIPESVVEAEESLIRSLRNYNLSIKDGKVVINQ